jgi:hypothetical protein
VRDKFPEKQSVKQKQLRRLSCPLEIKVLGALRVLGRGSSYYHKYCFNLLIFLEIQGACFDDIEELTYVSEEVHRKFYRSFVVYFSTNFYKEWITAPTSTEDIQETMHEYSAAGIQIKISCFAAL